MMALDPKGLEAARDLPGTNHEAIIRAYLSTVTPTEVGALVERLRCLTEAQIGSELDYIRQSDQLLNEAVTALEAQAAGWAADKARIAELEAGLANALAAGLPDVVAEDVRALLNGEGKG